MPKIINKIACVLDRIVLKSLTFVPKTRKPKIDSPKSIEKKKVIKFFKSPRDLLNNDIGRFAGG